ncbi:hypothetical protein [Streptomyces sp. CBMA29]|uniref:hypothetical protein n=1 Tax=Streptomyces sp. CBMA29 TaxID=1896314 RepID=UPI00166215F9|nr:hypothetical protein [Streptomyces sp. CBMA29]MBD0734000.1 hypothetical protein [Streptomyces sp. CBMA29]
MSEQRTSDLNGHRCVDTGKVDKGMPDGDQIVWECLDCQQRASRNAFSVGPARGCPARPESIDNLSVCPGGARCEGHPDQNSSQWREYTASNNLSIETVPRWFHTDNDLAKRAAAQYLRFADKVGVKMSVWTAEGIQVGPEGGTAAEMSVGGRSYEVRVNAYGKITATQKEN